MAEPAFRPEDSRSLAGCGAERHALVLVRVTMVTSDRTGEARLISQVSGRIAARAKGGGTYYRLLVV
jgi:hypothetical protein